MLKYFQYYFFFHAINIFFFKQSEISIYSLKVSLESNIVFAVLFILFKAIVVYGLVSNKQWSINLALGDACVQIVLYLVITLPQFLHPDLTKTRTVSSLIIFLIAYLLLLMELKHNRNSQLKMI